MLPTRVRALLAVPKSTKGANTARSAHTRQMVRVHFPKDYEDEADRTLACAMCGKANSKSSAAAPVIAGQKFTLK